MRVRKGLVSGPPTGESVGASDRRKDLAVKELKCRDVGFDCDAVVRGETEDDVMAQAGPHAKEAHGVDVTPDMAGQIRSLVRDT